jgi:Zn finger protein HypA/HybF involved in hydrogenase expression
MGEAVTDVASGGAQGGAQGFVSQKVWVCHSCSTVNPATATKCSNCGTAGETEKIDTVPATCPKCGNDRPFAPATGGQLTTQNADGTYNKTPETDETYAGDCPHCHQSAPEANDALDALKHGDKSKWNIPKDE